MKTNETILVEFIKDYNLDIPGQAVCFNADIEFTTASFSKKFNCEVHIITMSLKQQSVIYLLYEELAQSGIPDTFPFDPDSFFYKKNRSLTIIDYDLLRGKFNLVISPLNIKCNSKADLVD